MSEIIHNHDFCKPPQKQKGWCSCHSAGPLSFPNALPFFQTWETTAAIREAPETWRRPRGAEAAPHHHRGRPRWQCAGCCRSWPPSGASWRRGTRAERWPGSGCEWAPCWTGCSSASTWWQCWPTASPSSLCGPSGSILEWAQPSRGVGGCQALVRMGMGEFQGPADATDVFKTLSKASVSQQL